MFFEVIIAPALVHANESSDKFTGTCAHLPCTHALLLRCELTSIFILVLLSNSYLIHMLIATITIK